MPLPSRVFLFRDPGFRPPVFFRGFFSITRSPFFRGFFSITRSPFFRGFFSITRSPFTGHRGSSLDFGFNIPDRLRHDGPDPRRSDRRRGGGGGHKAPSVLHWGCSEGVMSAAARGRPFR